ncbi:metalloendopeptidase [Erythrobacteraceae bacterium CFH 75059]|uniref:murein hydrolase activator EnvC family protein n=1 Tax=Qipengyuania thermophila TaxID=2509361 RepID=UPI0010D40C8D|nr:peptidoglycan DD-metalloendopeptidase family protein [Qipengyuania thermophila]TCD06718.1 metalloendopeptidase [Erythrobacteraceae bacterium CFH 75059]
MFGLSAAAIVSALLAGSTPDAVLGPPPARETADLRGALEAAELAAAEARRRQAELENRAEQASSSGERLHARIAALAAELQQGEAQALFAAAQLARVERRIAGLENTLAAEQAPVAGLIAGLQQLARRPAVLTLLQPGGLDDAVHLRIMLAHAAPVVEQRTRRLRQQLREQQELQAARRRAMADLRLRNEAIARLQAALGSALQQQRALAAEARQAAFREEGAAQELARQARDIGELVARADAQAALAARLAALPGPVLRPQAGIAAAPAIPVVAATTAGPDAPRPGAYVLAAVGEVVAGFGEIGPDGVPRSGLALRTRPDALVLAPASGRVAFAGPFRGHGAIVIIDHGDGRTSLLTGLGPLDVRAGQSVAAGDPVGRAAGQSMPLGIELRQGGRPVDPLAAAAAGRRVSPR